jgi:hypothetical protein
MAKTSKERVRKWREKQAKKGGRSLSTWLEPETAQMLDYLLKHYGETAAPLVARAIAALYAATLQDAEPVCIKEEQPPDEITSESVCVSVERQTAVLEATQLSGQEQPATGLKRVLGNSLQDFDPALLEIKEKLAKGFTFKEMQKTLLVDWIKSMKAQSVSFQDMAERLNAAGIPTLSGKGRWEQGMIPTVLLLSSL